MRLFVGTLLLFSTGLAHAYVGPGLGVGVIGAILGLLAAVALAVIGTVWYPIKRMLRARSGPSAAGAEAPETPEPTQDARRERRS
jgi:hypothetical protein